MKINGYLERTDNNALHLMRRYFSTVSCNPYLTVSACGVSSEAAEKRCIVSKDQRLQCWAAGVQVLDWHCLPEVLC